MRVKLSALILGTGLLAGWLFVAGPTYAVNEADIAELLVKLMQAGRSVVSGHQDLINDPAKGNKGFTPEYAAERIIQKYKEMTGIDLSRSADTPQTRMLLTLLDSGKEVVAEAQPVINKQGVAFKGFIPAVWGRKTGEKFSQKTGIRLKLTSSDYRFPGNKPDEFEVEVLKIFADPKYPKGQHYSKQSLVSGKQVLRVMAPEYATASCLKCHGEPKGERDITGFKKEGVKEGGLAGAISLMIPIKEGAAGVSGTRRQSKF